MLIFAHGMYKKLIKPILFAISIERAHHLVIKMLRLAGMLPCGRWILRKAWSVEHPSLEREVFGVHFRNPIGLAAGFDRNGEVVNELSAMGFGFVEVGTVTPHAQSGAERPRVFRLVKDRAIVNRIGLYNKGLERMISHLRRSHEGIVVGCNIAKDPSTPPELAAGDYLKLFRNLYQYVDYFTVNISCGDATREEQAHSRAYVERILAPLIDFRRGQNQYRPIMLKVSPDVSDAQLDDIAQILIDTPLDGIVATNGTFRRDNLHTSRASLNHIGAGRLSGEPLTERAIEVVRRLHTASGGAYPIIGTGGMMSPADVRAMMDAGADLVQLYTGLIMEGPSLIGDICRSMIPPAPTPAESPAENA